MKAFENLFPRNILLDLYPWKNTELKRLGSIPAKYTREIKPRRKIPPKKITQKYTTKMKVLHIWSIIGLIATPKMYCFF